jgi:thiol:disulfide interchange protein DsbA
MKRLLPGCLMLLIAAGLFGCGKKVEAPAQAAAPAQVERPAAPAAATAGSEPVEPAPATAAEGEAVEEAPAAVSETADPVEPEQTAAAAPASSAQPVLRLGGPSAEPVSRQFKEGVHYQRVVPAQRTNVPPDKVEIIEMFWYGCGHCYALDPRVESWLRNGKPDYVEFVRVPVLWGNVHRMHARVFYTAEILGKVDELHPKIFRAIHVQGNFLDSEEKIQAFFTANGVSEADFKRAFSSFGVENKLKRAELIGRSYRVEAVPTFLINGKYRTGAGEAGGEEQLMLLLNELAAAEHGGA